MKTLGGENCTVKRMGGCQLKKEVF